MENNRPSCLSWFHILFCLLQVIPRERVPVSHKCRGDLDKRRDELSTDASECLRELSAEVGSMSARAMFISLRLGESA
jgi:hypothetical protein